jgi:AcrR family transcriptional regulator
MAAPGVGSRPPSPGEATRDALLDTAAVLFSERGFDGTSVRAITEAAGANLAAVTYHFGSKEGLYEAVLRELLRPMRSVIAQAIRMRGTPLSRIGRVVRSMVVHMGQNPGNPRLMLQQLTGSPLPHPAVQSLMKSNLQRLQALIEEGQADGSIRPGDSLLMAVSLLSQPAHMSIVLRPVQSIMDVDEDESQFLARMADHAAEFAVRALEAPGGAP